ncbi:MAG: site-specific integrase [Deltaproteobacteria bacterium]|nr:site-specific integrase [Deltaproteobacteria bacterium]
MNPIDEFLKNKTKRTQTNYRWILNQFFRDLKQDPETYFDKRDRNFKTDIEDIWWEQHLDEVPKTRNTKLAIVKGLMEDQEVVLPVKFWKKLRHKRKGSRTATLDRVPTEPEFKRMLRHGDVKDRALFLFVMSSGMRIDEALKVTPDMMDLVQDPPIIKLPGAITKNGDPRITFITQEAKEYILEWMKIRKQWLRRSIKRTGHLCDKDPNDTRLFPFSYDVARVRWIYLIKKTGLDDKDPTTKRYVLHIHCLRKYFLSQMKLQIPTVIPEALAGHEQYLDEAYRRYSQKQLGEYYKKGEPRITVLERTADLTGLQDEQNILKDENKDLKQTMHTQKLQIDIMEEKIARLLREGKR